ncbi:MAG: hypothetical protein M3O25_09775 [Actinomycetota bacterium]|nr:hypothetical protein [Actinomycetota bacterium]
MEDRPPFDADDELDFDFESSRRRHIEQHETGERFGEEGRGSEPEPVAEEEPSDEIEPIDEDEMLDPDTVEQRARARRQRERPSSGGLKLPRLGGRRRERRSSRSETGEQRRLRDDPFTPAEVPVPGSRRERRRDLPAKVRRRQAIGVGAVVVLLLGGGYALASSLSGGGDDESEPTPLKKLVGQTIVAKLGKEAPDRKLLKRVRKGQVGGFIVEPRNESALQEQLAPLNAAAEDGDNPPLLIMVDQEGGEVKRLPGPPNTAPADLGAAGDADAARTEGEQTGAYLAGLGINVDLAPVLDVELPRTAETIAERTFGEDPQLVSDLGSAFIEGLQSEGVAATAKHFPGLGTATVNTDFSPVTVAADQEDLAAAQIPFQGAIDAGVDLIMVSSAAYPGLGPDKPAVFAQPIVTGLLRQQLGFEGVVITDDMQAIAIQELGQAPGAEAVSALGAGCDLVLYARSDQGAVVGFNAAVTAAKQEKLTRDELQAASDRVTALKSELE